MTPLQAGSRYGQYFGLSLVVIGLGLKLDGTADDSWLAYGLYAVMPVAVLGALFGYQRVNRASPGFLQALLAGFAASTVAGALFGLFIFIYHGFYDDSLLLTLVADARSGLAAQGLSEQQINHAMVEIRAAHRPGDYALASFARMVAAGAVATLLFAPACGIASWIERRRRLRRHR